MATSRSKKYSHPTLPATLNAIRVKRRGKIQFCFIFLVSDTDTQVDIPILSKGYMMCEKRTDSIARSIYGVRILGEITEEYAHLHAFHKEVPHLQGTVNGSHILRIIGAPVVKRKAR